MSPTVFLIGPIHITLLGLFASIGMVVGLVVTQWETRRKGLPEDVVHTALTITVISGIVGARLYYLLVFAPSGQGLTLSSFLSFSQGGLSIQGALLGGIIGLAGYLAFKRVSIRDVADTVAPGLILGQAIGRIGCDVFGVETPDTIWWAVSVGERTLHPAQLYESLLNFVLFFILWMYRGRVRGKGRLFLIYVVGFSFNRFVVEFARVNPIAFGAFTVAHVTSLAMAVVALVLLLLPQLRGATVSAQRLPEVTVVPTKTLSALIATVTMMVISVLTYYAIYRFIF